MLTHVVGLLPYLPIGEPLCTPHLTLDGKQMVSELVANETWIRGRKSDFSAMHFRLALLEAYLRSLSGSGSGSGSELDSGASAVVAGLCFRELALATYMVRHGLGRGGQGEGRAGSGSTKQPAALYSYT